MHNGQKSLSIKTCWRSKLKTYYRWSSGSLNERTLTKKTPRFKTTYWCGRSTTKTSELESRRLLKSPEDTPVSLWPPQFKNVAQEYSGILAPHPNIPVHKRWWWKWDQKSWRPVWCTYLKMPSQTESDGCWGHNVHFGLTLLCFVLWSLGHLGEGEAESPSSEMCLSQSER